MTWSAGKGEWLVIVTRDGALKWARGRELKPAIGEAIRALPRAKESGKGK